MTEWELARFRALMRKAIAVGDISLPDFDRMVELSRNVEPDQMAEVEGLINRAMRAMVARP
jgi:hypothetical protein